MWCANPVTSTSRAELKAFGKDRLAAYKYPRFIEFVDELPKTATGKVSTLSLAWMELKNPLNPCPTSRIKLYENRNVPTRASAGFCFKP